MTSEGKLVRRAIQGRRDAFAALVRLWSHRVLALCHALVRNRTAAEDLSQETFVRAYAALGSLRHAEKFGPWLRGIARRACFDWIRSQQRPMVLFSQLGDDWSPDRDPSSTGARETEAVPDPLERDEETSRLLEELDKLPEEYRTALMLYYYGDHTYAQLAELLEVSVATVNSRLTKGRATLRTRMESMRR